MHLLFASSNATLLSPKAAVAYFKNFPGSVGDILLLRVSFLPTGPNTVRYKRVGLSAGVKVGRH